MGNKYTKPQVVWECYSFLAEQEVDGEGWVPGDVGLLCWVDLKIDNSVLMNKYILCYISKRCTAW